MAKKLTLDDGSQVVVDYAVRDGQGNIIDQTYLKKSEAGGGTTGYDARMPLPGIEVLKNGAVFKASGTKYQTTIYKDKVPVEKQSHTQCETFTLNPEATFRLTSNNYDNNCFIGLFQLKCRGGKYRPTKWAHLRDDTQSLYTPRTNIWKDTVATTFFDLESAANYRTEWTLNNQVASDNTFKLSGDILVTFKSGKKLSRFTNTYVYLYDPIKSPDEINNLYANPYYGKPSYIGLAVCRFTGTDSRPTIGPMLVFKINYNHDVKASSAGCYIYPKYR